MVTGHGDLSWVESGLLSSGVVSCHFPVACWLGNFRYQWSGLGVDRAAHGIVRQGRLTEGRIPHFEIAAGSSRPVTAAILRNAARDR